MILLWNNDSKIKENDLPTKQKTRRNTMNLIKHTIKRLDARFQETKNPCKAYKSEAAAEKAAEAMCEKVGMALAYDKDNKPHYFVVFHPGMDKYVPVIMMNEYMARAKVGGFIGIAAHAGFWCA